MSRSLALRIASIAVVLAGLTATTLAPVARAAPTGYTPLSPARVLDTRPGEATIDGQFSGLGLRPFASTLTLTLAGRGGVPSGAAAVVMNVTVADAQGPGFVTVYPCDAERPTASNLNYIAGQTVPNLVIARLSSAGTVCLYSLGSTHLIVDVAGYFAGTDTLTSLAAPARLLDTRVGSPTVDGQYAGTGTVPSGVVQQVAVVGRAGIPSGVSSVVLNVTATATLAEGFVTVYPCDAPRPTASNLNFVAGQSVPNAVVARVPASGMVCLFTSASTELIADVSGYFSDSSVVTPLAAPARLLDTRPGSPTLDGQFTGTGVRPIGGTFQLPISGRANIPSSASAVVLNVTVTEPQAMGFITAYPRGSGRPLASNLNYATSQTVANAVIAPLGVAGSVCLFNNAATHLVVDVVAYIAGTPPAASGAACPADPVSPPPPPPPPPSIVTRAPGQYLVNQTIPAGRYLMANAGNGCYWERQSGLGGTIGEVLANDFQGFVGPVIVDVLASDVGFEFDGDCGQAQTYTALSAPASTIAFGAFVIGTDVIAGTYAATAAYGCYWERRRSFDGTLSAIIANDFVDTAGPVVVTISTGDVGFYTNDDCGIWTRIS